MKMKNVLFDYKYLHNILYFSKMYIPYRTPCDLLPHYMIPKGTHTQWLSIETNNWERKPFKMML